VERFPDEMRQFLDGTIESIDQLEILRLAGEDPSREWTAAALAAEVQADPATTATDVAALRSRGLLAAETRGPDVVCRYAPATPVLGDLAGRLLALYRERPVSMIKLVAARARDPLRNFADAFRLRKEEG
jgi:hypothetical protein